jgi:preprotein translocase subunit SecE
MANKVVEYFQESYHELRKVAWPTRKEVFQNTLLVVVISLAVAIFLGILDYLFNLALKNVL